MPHRHMLFFLPLNGFLTQFWWYHLGHMSHPTCIGKKRPNPCDEINIDTPINLPLKFVLTTCLSTYQMSLSGFVFKCTVQTKSLDTPSHSKSCLYFHDYEYCSFTLKASKL
ncbi:hypothetical protein ILYODFUR_033508 [Ilyodon furcidens]|uniref:Secreted protein n=1 Tax=Ilyodon furcidens TaxID=33524 RepID=A0ABV0UZK0_9TELE